MRRRRRAYVIKYPHSAISMMHFRSTTQSSPYTLPQSQPSPSYPHIPIVESAIEESFSTVKRSETFKLRPKKVRRALIQVCGISAVLGWVVTVLAFVDIKYEDRGEDLIRGGICVVSVVQAGLGFVYAELTLRYKEYLRLALRTSPTPTPPLLRSPHALISTLLEATFHLLILPPRLCFQGKIANLSVEDILFLLILLRNYHSFRLFYWYSRFSEPRSSILSSFSSRSHTFRSTLRSYISSYSLPLILTVYSVFTVFSGLVLYLLERNAWYSQFDYTEDGLWVVAVMQTTVGYGEIVPRTLFSEVYISINCVLGSCLVALITSTTSHHLSLSHTEGALYSEMTYRRYRRKHEKPAVILIQRWWKFISNRVRHVRNGRVIIDFYTQLRTHRRGLAAAKGEKDHNFGLQLNAFEGAVGRKLRAAEEYMRPVAHVVHMVRSTQTVDILRSAYKIKSQARALIYKSQRRSRRGSSGVISVFSLPTPRSTAHSIDQSVVNQQRRQSLCVPRNMGMGFAIARQKAHKRAKGRLSLRKGNQERGDQIPSPISAFL